MSWLRVDDSFTDNAKTALLSDAAFVLWLRCACWARKPANQHTGGFIPKALLVSISRMSKSKATKAAQELVDANAGGTKKFGLWEPREGGWQFHDWEQYLPQAEEKLSPNEAASRAGKASAEARKRKFGTSQPPRTSPNERRTFEERSTEHVRPNESRTSRTPNPEPNPEPISEQTTTVDQRSTEHVRPNEPPNDVRSSSGGDVDCPIDLALSDTEFAQLQLGTGMTRDFVDRATPALRAQFASQNARSLDKWQRTLVKALTGAWNNVPQRKRYLETLETDTPPLERSRVRKAEAFSPMEYARKLAAEEADAKAAGGQVLPLFGGGAG